MKKILTIKELRNLPFRNDLTYEEEMKELKRNIMIYGAIGITICTSTAIAVGSVIPLLLYLPAGFCFAMTITS